ncbi:MAG: N-acetylmuramoyl-L-alanine amidase [Flavobacteriaceae bacterium]|nr:MAG: N-acetylmuramoyl-L-alanine amidase [Flavobacteriaceae bacterium]
MNRLFKAYVFLAFLNAGILPVIHTQNKQYVVVLDAGHGGKDPGTLGNGYKEKNIALEVTLLTRKLLAKYKDIKVIYTRNKDVFVELHDRAKIANKTAADLFVSLHCDSHASNAYGAGTFVLGLRGNKENLEIAKRENSVIFLEKDYEKNYDYDLDSPESMIGLSLLQEENLDKSLEIASLIQNNLVHNLKRHDRKVRQDNFLVLRNTVMPSVLIELGFLSNKKEARYLNSKKGQAALANTITLAIRKYIDRLKLNTIQNTTTVVNDNTEIPKKGTLEFKVQIASGKRKISPKPYNFKGLKNVERVKVGNYYKYYYGTFKGYREALKYHKKAKRKGYTSAFITAFKNGKKISIAEAMKLALN